MRRSLATASWRAGGSSGGQEASTEPLPQAVHRPMRARHSRRYSPARARPQHATLVTSGYWRLGRALAALESDRLLRMAARGVPHSSTSGPPGRGNSHNAQALIRDQSQLTNFALGYTFDISHS